MSLLQIPKPDRGRILTLEGMPDMVRPPYVSHSQINTFLRCPHSYYLSYIKGIKTQMPDYVTFGSDIHKELEGVESSRDRDLVKPYVEKVTQFFTEQNDKVINKEYTFEVDLFGRNIKGVIDVVTKGYKIWDYKVTSNPSYLKNKIGYQLPLYKYAMEQIFEGEYTPGYLFLKRSSKYKFLELIPEVPDLTPAIMKGVLGGLDKILDDIDELWENSARAYHKHDEKGCRMCSVRGRCQYYNG